MLYASEWKLLCRLRPAERYAITQEAVSVTNRAANVIPRVHLGTYIFISFFVCESARLGASPFASVDMLIERLNKENDSGDS
jgi:hypothetical protein